MRDPIVIEVESDFEELIPLFLEQRRKDQVVMARALEIGDFEAMRVVGHGMAGSGSSYGFLQITAMGEAIERAARDRDHAELVKQAALLADYMERIVVNYV
jgi:HPt (histidine-containing phosphotransfer) domain-containing protein